MESIDFKETTFKTYAALMEITLLIYFRLSEAPTQRDKQTMYDLWLIDIPKMLDLASVYGGSNPNIVKKLIDNVYKAHSNYDQDTLDFFTSIEKHPTLVAKNDRLIEIDFTSKSLKNKRFGNREHFMLQETTK